MSNARGEQQQQELQEPKETKTVPSQMMTTLPPKELFPGETTLPKGPLLAEATWPTPMPDHQILIHMIKTLHVKFEWACGLEHLSKLMQR